MNVHHQEVRKSNEVKAGKATKITYYVTTGIISAAMMLIGLKRWQIRK